MATTTGTVVFYQAFIATMLKEANMSTDSFKVGLCTSSYTPSASTHAVLTDITNECSGNGYARQTLTSTYAQTAGVGKFDFTDPVFTAAGGSITARYFFLFDDTLASPVKPLVCYGLLDQSNADVVTTSGNTLTLNIDANGLFTVTVV